MKQNRQLSWFVFTFLTVFTTLLVLGTFFPHTFNQPDSTLAQQNQQPAQDSPQGEYRVIGWNDLGMHCYNDDFQDFAVLPPFNTLWAQVIKVGPKPEIVTSGIRVSYRFPDNTYSVGKTNFWDYEHQLFGVDLPPNVGLTGNGLAGDMEAQADHFVVEGIPLTEYSDSNLTTPDPYQLAEIVVYDEATGAELARNQVVAPASTEMNCGNCHHDGGVQGIATGRVETNILTLHDQMVCSSCHSYPYDDDDDDDDDDAWDDDDDHERGGDDDDDDHREERDHDDDDDDGEHGDWDSVALDTAYNLLLAEMPADDDDDDDDVNLPGHPRSLMERRPVLCAECHASNALGKPGVAGIPNLSNAMHRRHSGKIDNTLEGCYTCHPGPQTQCLRDTMSQSGMTCIDCHGTIEEVAQNPEPWLNEPRCDTCHPREGSNLHVQQNNPLYRLSTGHGGLYCSACHDSPHAIAPSREPDDGIKFVNLQGNPGTLRDCTVCHGTVPDGRGPHGITVQSTQPVQEAPQEQQPVQEAPQEQQPAQAPAADERCFPETGFCIAGRIREFWETQGGLEVFGYPTTPQREEIIEGQPYQVQWFERNRLELHPENPRPYDVLMGRLGADLLELQGRNWRDFATSEPQADCRSFAETGHTVCGEFLSSWQADGLELDGQPDTSMEESLALYGLPLSDAQTETLGDGNEYVVQWFERVRLELHPENEPPYRVLKGLLGNEVRDAEGN